jgi:hypothetical protein
MFPSSVVKRVDRDEDKVFNEDVVAYEPVTLIKAFTLASLEAVYELNDEVVT